MWRLSKDHGIKPWEYWGDYEENGTPILYQEDILMLRWFDQKEAEYEYRQHSKGSGSGFGAKGGQGQQQQQAAQMPGIGIVMPPGKTFGTTVPGPPQPDRPAN
jgi:hypothetical protein